jgi:hypothetical protein
VDEGAELQIPKSKTDAAQASARLLAVGCSSSLQCHPQLDIKVVATRWRSGA